MIVDAAKAKALIAQPFIPVAADELRRQENVFFVGGHIPPSTSLESIFESDCQSPAELFAFQFASLTDFQRAEELVRAIKRNFRGYLLGQFLAVPSPQLIEHAYAAGLDFIDIPLSGDIDRRLEALRYAGTVFPRWSTVSTLHAGEKAAPDIIREIDLLLDNDVLPLVSIGRKASSCSELEISTLFQHLAKKWRSRKAAVKPLHPLLFLTTPFAPPPRRGLVHGLLGRIGDASLRTTSDLRRLLRVKEVNASFESAGL